jgi:cytochrome c-type biogenesis protein CcmE
MSKVSLKLHQVLAKHDENYMPPEAKNAIQAAQQWESKKTLQYPMLNPDK